MAEGGAGRAMGGGAGRAMAGGEAGRCGTAAGAPLLGSCADEPTLAAIMAIIETPRRNAAKRTPNGSMIVAPW